MQTKKIYILHVLEDYLQRIDGVLNLTSVSGFDMRKLHADFISMKKYVISGNFLSSKLLSEFRFIRFPDYFMLPDVTKSKGRYVLQSHLSHNHISHKLMVKKSLNIHREDLLELYHKIDVMSVNQEN